MTKQEFMAMSLLYELKCMVKESGKMQLATLAGIVPKSIIVKPYMVEVSNYQFDVKTNIPDFLFNVTSNSLTPILRPLSDLTKEIEQDGKRFVPIEALGMYNSEPTYRMLIDDIEYGHVKLGVALRLIEWHFDIAGLIEQGEAIDINTLNEKIY